ncbi:MAG TPA: L-histidine N(alpha)-methyltransferase [Terriglobia bacterium]|nr:L-histidine N(alpha)-methyltransferase [Terriglobia bacterium]
MLLPSLKADPAAAFAEDVYVGLTKPEQKELPSKYLYDEIGSALFEVITLLPEYGLTRADERLLRRYSAEVAAKMSSPAVVAELGSGSGKKARWILEALARRHPTTYYPIEISHAALMMVERELDRLERVSILGFETEYLDGLRRAAGRRNGNQRLLVLFLGSSIGNFDSAPAERFLQSIRQILIPGDALLLSADLIKPVAQMVRAYDDPAGVTAAFNLNLLARINRELEADFDLSNFRHVALYNEEECRIEMHLRSLKRQTARIARADLSIELDLDETIWTENSYKYTLEEIVLMAARAGFRCEIQWVDEEWPFALNMLVPI